MLNKLERRFGKYAIPNLTFKMVIVFVIGYFLSMFAGNYLTFNPYLIFKGQIWRLISWIFIPLQNNLILYLISIGLFYFPLGRTMEQAWGDFKYNLYIFTGLVLTIIASLICYAGYAIYVYNIPGLGSAEISQAMEYVGSIIGGSTIPYYVAMSIFFAYAATFPNATILLMFIIPIQMKWLGIAYAALFGYELIAGIISGQWPSVVVILASGLTFALFFVLNRNSFVSRSARRYRPSEVKRRSNFRREVENARSAQRMVPPGSAHHKCAVCGRTELDDPSLEFRYCSKCNGAYEYCQDHLFTHVHVK